MDKALYAFCFVAHFLKRLYENRFVHIFSHAHTPLVDLAMDVAYYWSFAAVIGYGVNSGRCEDLDNGRLSEYDSALNDKIRTINGGVRSMVRPVGALRVREW